MENSKGLESYSQIKSCTTGDDRVDKASEKGVVVEDWERQREQ